MDYQDFIARKRIRVEPIGKEVGAEELGANLFPFQRDLVQWALRKGRAALFADTGLGKTLMLLTWAHHAAETSLVLAPLAVAAQIGREGAKFGIPVQVCRTQADVMPGRVNVTNYDRLHHFTPDAFGAIVLDESSILKNYSSSTRQALTEFAATIPFRLACTATPAPNDLFELTNHAEFLGVMTGNEVRALFFISDGNTTHDWRLKGHAKRGFYEWMASWAAAVRKPSDLGHADDGYDLPPLNFHPITVDSDHAKLGALFALDSLTLEQRRQARKDSIVARVGKVAELANASAEPWIIWCDLNEESQRLVKAIPGAVEVTGSDTPEFKEQAMLDFSEGRIRVLVTKPSIAGFGLNWQHCAKVAFVGLSDSYEQLYQAVRRCWRFGQTRPVDCYLVASEAEGVVRANIARKEAQAKEMMENLKDAMSTEFQSIEKVGRDEADYREDTVKGQRFTMMLGDSVKRIDELESDSVGLCVHSPPFPGLYAYSNSERDLGNTRDIDDFVEHYRYLMGRDKLMRVMKPGRICAIHLMQLTAMKSRDGFIGLKDYRGAVTRMMVEEGWIFHGEVTIEKNPQVQATRNKERGLLFKSLATDASVMRMALADYLILFRKPGENTEPIKAGVSEKYGNPQGWITEEEWIEWASPIWYRQRPGMPGGISEGDVLNNFRHGREEDDEKHLCPLQLGVIERAVKLWSNPGDLVFSPFGGIGSEGYVALKHGRRATLCELKPSYFEVALKNLKAAEFATSQATLFDGLAA